MFIAPSDQPPVYEPLGAAQVVERTPNAVRLKSGHATIEVTALAENLFRVGLFGDGRPVSYRSDAVAKTDWSMPAAKIAADGASIETATASALLSLNPLRIGFRAGTREFAVDDPQLGMGFAPLAPAESLSEEALEE